MHIDLTNEMRTIPVTMDQVLEELCQVENFAQDLFSAPKSPVKSTMCEDM